MPKATQLAAELAEGPRQVPSGSAYKDHVSVVINTRKQLGEPTLDPVVRKDL